MIKPHSVIKAFLCYHNNDGSFVRRFDNALRTFCIDTFFDEKNINNEEAIPSKIYKEIGSSTHFLCFISRKSKKSNWVKDELSKALMLEKKNRGIIIIPIFIEKTKIPISLCDKKTYDFCNQTINTRGRQFKLILASLGMTEQQINEKIRMLTSSKTKSLLSKILINTADLQIILSDVSFLLRFATQHANEEVCIRRLLETKQEIKYRKMPERIEEFLSEIKNYESEILIQVVIKDIGTRASRFINKITEVLEYQPAGRPKTDWLNECSEAARALQRRIGQLHYQLLLLLLKGTF